MTKTLDLAALAATGEARPIGVLMTRAQLLEHVAASFAQTGNRRFKLLVETEYWATETLRTTSTTDNIFAHVETTLGDIGLPTNGTIGRVMDNLGLSEEDVHDFACYCHTCTSQIDGANAASRLRTIAGRKA
ncbi:MAG TPA: hypothetical protein VMU13_01085 [Candidatus Paceibacterota bacterium]|nr:hypothetical protein [Candidatus Paceibacterota bacterium]